MKAIVCTKYGSPDTLQLQEVPRPIPKDNEALVKIHATSLNATDFETLRGVFIIRMVSPFKPMYKILGTDIAGRIEVVGTQEKQFQPGDAVWADLSFPLGFSSLAEYVAVPAEALRPKPASMTFEQAAAYPQAAVLALQNLRGVGSSSSLSVPVEGLIQPGKKVLINGAGGGAGTFAVQLAKHFGAEVTGVDSAKKLEMLRSLGADHVIDYKQEDYTKTGQRYDLILDVVANRSIFAYKRALTPEGMFVYVGASTAAIFQAMALGPLISRTGTKKLGIVMGEPNRKEDYSFLTELFL